MVKHNNTKHNNTKYNNRSRTFKNRYSSSSTLSEFQKEITVVFFEMLLMVKLYHWKTHSYPTHKATDELYSKLNEEMDSFIEILLGKTGKRTDLTGKKNIRLMDFKTDEELKREVNTFKNYLVGLNNNKAMTQMSNSDLYNIRDTILGELNQFLYLLTFN